jgi:hypothetical protein
MSQCSKVLVRQTINTECNMPQMQVLAEPCSFPPCCQISIYAGRLMQLGCSIKRAPTCFTCQCANAGQLQLERCGAREQVAVKAINSSGFTAAEALNLHRKLGAACTLSRRLEAFGIELRGFVEHGNELWLVMERARTTVKQMCTASAERRLSTVEWVRVRIMLGENAQYASSMVCLCKLYYHLTCTCPD